MFEKLKNVFKRRIKETDDVYEKHYHYEVWLPVFARVRYNIEAKDEDDAIEQAKDVVINGDSNELYSPFEDEPVATSIWPDYSLLKTTEVKLNGYRLGKCKYCSGRKNKHKQHCPVDV